MAKIQAIDIQFNELTYEIQIGYRGSKKQILKGLDGLFKSGELTVIMGPSGAGKSTLLNVLSGFQEGKLSGTIDYIGDDGKCSPNRYKKQSCYIQQTDCLYGLFTVYESMRIATYLKIDNNITEKYRQMLIDDILDDLQLSQVKNTKAERLSGGQRKRLSIALELIDNLPIMFLDEPTTGLDSLSSFYCVTALKSLANAGRTVICTVHQPSAAIYQMFDHVYLVVDGRYMYAGKPADTVDYFAQQGFRCPMYHNPADYILEMVSQEYGDYNGQLIAAAKAAYRRSEIVASSAKTRDRRLDEAARSLVVLDDERTRAQRNPPSELRRFWILLRRYALLLHRDWTTTYMRLVLHFLVAVLLGLFYEHAGDDGSKSISNVSYVFVSVVYLSYTSMMPAVVKFPLELAILKKERFNNWYQLKTYYAALLVTGIPIQVTAALVYVLLSYLMTSQPLEWSRFFMFLFIMILTTFNAESIGLYLGTIFNPVNGTFMGAIIVSIQIALTGFLAFFNHMPVFLYYVSYLNYFRYSMEGMVQAIYGNARRKLRCPSPIIYCHYNTPSILLEELNMSRPTFWLDFGVLVGFYTIIRIMVYIGLKRRLSKAC